jgi:hypothetical protein
MALTPTGCELVLDLVHGEPVQRVERPVLYTTSPALLVGVDCDVRTQADARVRGVGTIIEQASITGGRAVQVSMTATLAAGDAPRRLPWSHYLAQPGRLELLRQADLVAVAERFLEPRQTAGTLDMGGIGLRRMTAVQTSGALDHRPPMKAARTVLRWASICRPAAERARVVEYTVPGRHLRTLRLEHRDADAGAVRQFCADVALHDWLLTTLLSVLDRSRIGLDSRTEVVTALQPAVDHLLHLWMPAARADRVGEELWQSLDRRPGLTRQWQRCVDRVRDQLVLASIAAVEGVRR